MEIHVELPVRTSVDLIAELLTCACETCTSRARDVRDKR